MNKINFLSHISQRERFEIISAEIGIRRALGFELSRMFSLTYVQEHSMGYLPSNVKYSSRTELQYVHTPQTCRYI